jgi:putative hydrolase
MKIQVDTHTHSVASLHAYSTIDELAKGARRNRLRAFVLTEHGPALQGYPHPYYFGNLKVLPEKIYGVLLYKGVELNIMREGGVDLADYYLKRLDFVMAGFHEACFKSSTVAMNTDAMIAALANPLVDGISHPGNPPFPVDYEAVVAAAAQYGKALEINNSSFKTRQGSDVNCKTIAELCKKYGALVTCGSDAHYWRDVGNFNNALALIRAVGLDPAQVVNQSLAGFQQFSGRRKKERGAV